MLGLSLLEDGTLSLPFLENLVEHVVILLDMGRHEAPAFTVLVEYLLAEHRSEVRHEFEMVSFEGLESISNWLLV